MEVKERDWDIVLTPKHSAFSFPWKELWYYRDLLMMFVRRDVVTLYKQTILGPIWFFVQPILTTLTYLIVFGRIAKLSTDGIPGILFYSSGIVMWNYFSETLTATSRTFVENANLFGKVYFPRAIMPLSKVVSGLLKYFVQLLFFLAVFFYYLASGAVIHPEPQLFALPLLIIIMAIIGFALGIIFSSLTTKYRDLSFLIAFGVQLMMYATPVIYPLSSVPEKFRFYVLLNPITSLIEGFRFAFLGTGEWSWQWISYSGFVAMILLVVGLMIFNRVEKTFMDTV
jgi:lipopolysaccharide transport system permease protein